MSGKSISRCLVLFTCSLLCAVSSLTATAGPPRARDLGVPFAGTPGACNAITDVAGVEVGHHTLIQGDGTLVVGKGPVRTGVTAIFPAGRDDEGFVQAGVFVANGTGELTGRALIEELGLFSGPVMLTGTGSVGIVRDSVIAWYRQRLGGDPARLFPHILPVVGETYDGFLNDSFGQHIRAEHVFAALDGARGGRVEEGSVGGGTGMMAFAFKGGIGTSSRVAAPGTRWVHRRCAGAVQLRWTQPVDDRGGAGRRGDHGPHADSRSRQGRLDHRSDRHRCAVVAASAATDGAARDARHGPHRWHVRHDLGRHLPGVLDGQAARARSRAT